MANNSVGTPGLDDLIIPLFDIADPEKIARAAANTALPVSHGIRAIGELITIATEAEGTPIESHTLNSLGYLLAHLADLAEICRIAESNAHYDMWKRAEAELEALKKAGVKLAA